MKPPIPERGNGFGMNLEKSLLFHALLESVDLDYSFVIAAPEDMEAEWC